MNSSFSKTCCVGLMALTVVAVIGSIVLGQEPKDGDTATRQFWADAKVHSFRPGETLASYRWNPSGGVGASGTLTLGGRDGERRFDVKIVAKLKSQRFI